MIEKTEDRGAVEIVMPNLSSESVDVRLKAIRAVACACKQLAIALNIPLQSVSINGNITANAQYGVRTKLKK